MFILNASSIFEDQVCDTVPTHDSITMRQVVPSTSVLQYWRVAMTGTAYRLVQIERPKLCPREFLTPFFRVRPRNFAHIFWKAVSKTRRGGFFLFGVSLSRYPGFDPPTGQVLQPGPRITGHRDKKLKKNPLRVLDSDVQNMCAKFRGLTRRNGVRKLQNVR